MKELEVNVAVVYYILAVPLWVRSPCINIMKQNKIRPHSDCQYPYKRDFMLCQVNVLCRYVCWLHREYYQIAITITPNYIYYIYEACLCHDFGPSDRKNIPKVLFFLFSHNARKLRVKVNDRGRHKWRMPSWLLSHPYKINKSL